MINYSNEEIKFEGCPGCAYANHEFSIPCGMAYENENFNLSQDWEIPIPGFLILAPNRHVSTFEDFLDEERIEMFDIINKTINILKENDICDYFDVIFEEKAGRHFHIWILPRYEWMKNITGNITQNIGKIFEYAKENMRTEENYQKINEVTNIIKNTFEISNKRKLTI